MTTMIIQPAQYGKLKGALMRAVDKIDDVSKVSLKQFTISAKVRY